MAHYRTPAESRGTSKHGVSNFSETSLPLGAVVIVIVVIVIVLLSLGRWWAVLSAGHLFEHVCVPYLFPQPAAASHRPARRSTSAAKSSKARQAWERPNAFIGYKAEQEGAYATRRSISDLRRLPSRRKPSVEQTHLRVSSKRGKGMSAPS